MPTARVNGVRINYVQADSQDGHHGEDLVMVHGLATNLAFWYFHYAPAFSKRYRVTLFDLPGHGRSEMPRGGYTPKDLGTILRLLLNELGIERSHVFAHSFGGLVAMNMACTEPTRVRSLVLADTHISSFCRRPGYNNWADGNEIQALLNLHGIALDASDPYFGYRLLTEVARLQMDGASIPQALLDLVSPLIGKHGNRTAAQWLKLMRNTNAETELMGDDGLTLERLREFAFPILAMYGDRSQARLTGERLLEAWPHAQFRRMRGAGHFFPTTRPEDVIGLSDRFWDGKLAKEQANRAGEMGRKHFRSDRVYQIDGGWYFATRECAGVGPFSNRDEVKEHLAAYISSVTRSG